MKYFQVDLHDLKNQIPFWLRNYFHNLIVIRSNEDRVIWAIENCEDVRLIVERIDLELVRLECRRYEELQPEPKQLNPRAQEACETLAHKIGEFWKELPQIPYGEGKRSAERIVLLRELQATSAVLHYLRNLGDEKKPAEFEEILQRYEAEHQKLEQRRGELQQELDEIFAVDAERVVEEDVSSVLTTILTTTPVLSDHPNVLSRDQESGLQYSTEDDLRQWIVTIAADVGTPQWWEQISVLHYRYKHIDPKHTISKMAVLLQMDEKHVGKQIRKHRPKTP